MSRRNRILFVADLNEYSNGYGRLRALDRLAVETVALSHTPIGGAARGYPERSFGWRAAARAGIHRDTEAAGRRMVAAAKRFRPALIWLEKGVMIAPGVLRRLRRAAPDAVLVSYTDDDMFLAHNRTRAYAAGLALYDCVFTTKVANALGCELESLGARRVVLVDKAFDARQFRPVALAETDRAALGTDVGFVGSFERARADSLLFLARNGVPVRVWGNGWEAMGESHPALRVERRAVVNTDADPRYSRCICATRINLGFLRKLNRDQHTDRSVEIPACGGFLLAERSADHTRLFADGREAAFFADDAEMLAKARHYLDHEDERAAIARAGRARCLGDGHDMVSRMREMLTRALGEPVATADDDAA